MEICQSHCERKKVGDWKETGDMERSHTSIAGSKTLLAANYGLVYLCMGNVFHNLAQQYPSGENTGIRMRKCEERMNGRGQRRRGRGGGGGGGGERETEQISCIQISRVAAPCALLLLAWPGTGRTNTRKQATKPATHPPPSSRAKLLLGQRSCSEEHL